MNGRRYFIAARQSLSPAWMMAIITIILVAAAAYIFKFNFPRQQHAKVSRGVAWWQKGLMCAPTRAYNYYNDNSLPRSLEMCVCYMPYSGERCVIIKVLFSLLMSYKHSNNRRALAFVFNLYTQRALTRHLSSADGWDERVCVRETHLQCVDDGWSGNLNN